MLDTPENKPNQDAPMAYVDPLFWRVGETPDELRAMSTDQINQWLNQDWMNTDDAARPRYVALGGYSSMEELNHDIEARKQVLRSELARREA